MSKKNQADQSDSSRSIRYLNHNALPVEAKGTSLIQAALNYLQNNAEYYHLNPDDFKNMPLQLEEKFTVEKASFRLEVQKDLMDTITFIFVQTYFGLPVWEAGLSVAIDKKRQRILSSLSSAYDEIEVSNAPKTVSNKSLEPASLYKAFGLENEIKLKKTDIKIQSERLLIYRYKAENRTLTPLPNDRQEKNNLNENEFILPLPPVPDSIKEGSFYIVKEIIFNYPLPGAPALLWRAFIELQTGAVLFLRAFGSNATGMVFQKDPITKGSGLTPGATNAALTGIRDSITFANLNPPSAAGIQSLTGSLVSVQAVEGPTVAAPTEGSPYNFNYNARTNNFAAANTYYHCNGFLQLVLDMGFGMTYFNGTVFPVPCDHRGLSQPNTGETTTSPGSSSIFNAINAHCLGTSTGIASVDFALADVSDIALPVTSPQITADHLGIACDNRVALHEIGGHGVLYCHVGGANFGFSHSAGDSIAVIINDPGTLAPDRFVSFPWVNIGRRHDRTPASGWGWAGSIALNPFNTSLDYGGYNNEQILSTTLFRLYRSIGGDSSDINMQRFASRFAVYLTLKAISTLTTTTNPPNASAFELAMENGDASDWHSSSPLETHSGGAYMKVIRWAFEKQGLFQTAGTITPNNNIGAPPAVDVYIDDGRHGEYTFQPNHWSCQDIWNRTDLTMGDGGGVHQEPIIGQTNYAYVRIKNRGYNAATSIVVKGFHCLPGVGLVYPNDWIAMATPQLTAPNLAASDSTGEVVGPFEWVPSQLGHECMFFTVSATGDPCNIDGRVVGPIPEWRLVPNDNNIGQRNVAPVASSLQGLIASFENRPFWIRNTFDREVPVEINVQLPEVFVKNNWKLTLVSEGGQSFFLKPGERKKAILKMVAGNNFNIKDDAANKQIEITVKQDGIVVGGMNYYVDPNIEYPANQPGKHDKDCKKTATSLIEGLDLPNMKIKSVTIRKINIDICFDDDCEC